MTELCRSPWPNSELHPMRLPSNQVTETGAKRASGSSPQRYTLSVRNQRRRSNLILTLRRCYCQQRYLLTLPVKPNTGQSILDVSFKLSRLYFCDHTSVLRPWAAIFEIVPGAGRRFHGSGQYVLQARLQFLTLRVVFLSHQRRNAMIQKPITILRVVIKSILIS
jgi:hypothetical protein